ncbi:hypothetical protein ZWY2020_037943 [Hordeum vulgare]|nr:hypothetical protein ZWY2020_037943 [Hordeum vulgare]
MDGAPSPRYVSPSAGVAHATMNPVFPIPRKEELPLPYANQGDIHGCGGRNGNASRRGPRGNSGGQWGRGGRGRIGGRGQFASRLPVVGACVRPPRLDREGLWRGRGDKGGLRPLWSRQGCRRDRGDRPVALLCRAQTWVAMIPTRRGISCEVAGPAGSSSVKGEFESHAPSGPRAANEGMPPVSMPSVAPSLAGGLVAASAGATGKAALGVTLAHVAFLSTLRLARAPRPGGRHPWRKDAAWPPWRHQIDAIGAAMGGKDQRPPSCHHPADLCLVRASATRPLAYAPGPGHALPNEPCRHIITTAIAGGRQ